MPVPPPSKFVSCNKLLFLFFLSGDFVHGPVDIEILVK